MKILKRLLKLLGRLLIGFMFAVCVATGVAPIIPKRKEQFGIEIKMEKKERANKDATAFIQPEKKG